MILSHKKLIALLIITGLMITFTVLNGGFVLASPQTWPAEPINTVNPPVASITPTTGGSEGGPTYMGLALPHINILTPYDNEEITGVIQIKAEARKSSSGGPANFAQFLVDGKPISKEIINYKDGSEWAGKYDARDASRFFAKWDSTRVADGVHVIGVRAGDNGAEKTVEIQVIVKNGITPPPPTPTSPPQPPTACDSIAKAVIDAAGGCSKIDSKIYSNVYSACCSLVTKDTLLKMLNDALADGVIDKTEKASLLGALNNYLSKK